jgi:hypothetical protein
MIWLGSSELGTEIGMGRLATTGTVEKLEERV